MKNYFEKIKQQIMKITSSKAFKISIFSLGVFIVASILSICVYSYAYSQKIYPNINIGSIDFGGLSKEEAKIELSNQINEVKSKDISLHYEDKSWDVPLADLQINYDQEKTISSLFSIGRRGSIFQKVKERIISILSQKKLLAVYSYNKISQEEITSKIKSGVNVAEKNANFVFKDGVLSINPEKKGKSLDEKDLNKKFLEEIGYFGDREVEIFVLSEDPKITESELTALQGPMNNLIVESIILKSDQDTFNIEPEKIFTFVDIVADKVEKKDVSKNNLAHAKEKIEYYPKIIINPEIINIYIEEVSYKTNKKPIDAKLTISDGKATVFVPSQEGFKLNQEETLASITKILDGRLKVAGENTASDNSLPQEINLPLSSVKPAITSDTIDNLGIKELIGKGSTNYKGSPKNRITNIKVGSSMFNGMLVKPGETFSTLETLGDISTEQGFLPELVIKEDSTKPEVGGGLCQVSTTLFRAVLNAGLPVVERTNHKYRVSYYEPPVGMDATIYDPSPDFKFKNDTNGYILIQTYISGTELTFEFYGTKDGRIVEMSDPVIYETSSPGEAIYKDDPSLAPGEVKQVEKAHAGAKASFHYKVIRNEEILYEKTFYSNYVAWNAVYLRGPGEAPPEENPPAEGENPPAENPPD